MQIQCYTLGSVGTHCYLLIQEETGEALLVDPADRGEFLEEKLTQQNLTLKGILLTHGHGDHIMAVSRLRETYQVPVLAHQGEQELLADPEQNLSQALFGCPVPLAADRWLGDGELVELAGLCLRVLHTPGHTPGSCCYYMEKEGVLFSGDTLFCASVGRTDFPGGSMSTLLHSIREKLLPLPDETKVYPGHAELTAIGEERRYNPYFR